MNCEPEGRSDETVGAATDSVEAEPGDQNNFRLRIAGLLGFKSKHAQTRDALLAA